MGLTGHIQTKRGKKSFRTYDENSFLSVIYIKKAVKEKKGSHP